MPGGEADLLFDTGYRYSNYSSTPSGSNQIGFEAHTRTNSKCSTRPYATFRLRVGYDKAIRAPSVIELYNPELVALIASGNDPCAPPVTYSQSQCANLGVSAAQYAASKAGHAVNGVNPVPQCVAGQCSQLTGGNTGLQPEQGETYTIGVNFQPSFLPKFTASLDYWHILIEHEVNVLPAANIISGCANTGNPVYCSAVVRAPATGGLQGSSLGTGGYVVQTNVNLGSVMTSGMDMQFAYTQDLPEGFGNVHFDMNGTWLQHSVTTPVPGGASYDCAGLFGLTCQTVNPRWHHILRTTWNTPWQVSASLTWRYFGAVSQDADTGNPLLANTNYDYDAYNARIGSFSWMDVEATWHPTKILTVRAGANNVFDRDPPLLVAQTGIVAGGNANTSDAYDMFDGAVVRRVHREILGAAALHEGERPSWPLSPCARKAKCDLTSKQSSSLPARHWRRRAPARPRRTRRLQHRVPRAPPPLASAAAKSDGRRRRSRPGQASWGYSVMRRKDQVFYCRTEIITGNRIAKGWREGLL